LKDEISKGNKKYDILKNNYDSLEDQYLKLKAKFEGIKNFFS
jgi:molecular chaperone GrpE (heat shock protein)